jgi:hypothetical protein
MRNAFLIASVLALAAVGAHEAGAGRKHYYNVQVDNTARWAGGTMGTVRSSSDTVQYLGCFAYYWPGVAPSLWCFAQPITGSAASCSTTDPNMLSMYAAMPSDAQLRFSWNGGACTEFIMQNRSENQPKAP